MIYASQDEIGRVLDWDVDETIVGGIELMNRLRPLVRNATIVLTRGGDGALVLVPGEAEV